jgi:hypothetical protein
MAVGACARGFSYVNRTQQFHHPATITFGVAGIDFNVLTRRGSRPWFERWIFPREFGQSLRHPSNPAKLHIGRMLRYFGPFPEPASVFSKRIAERDPIEGVMDTDYLYRVTRIFEEKAFFEGLVSEKVGSTELSYDIETDKYSLHLRAGAGSMKFRIDEEESSQKINNQLLDGMLPPTPKLTC